MSNGHYGAGITYGVSPTEKNYARKRKIEDLYRHLRVADSLGLRNRALKIRNKIRQLELKP